MTLAAPTCLTGVRGGNRAGRQTRRTAHYGAP